MTIIVSCGCRICIEDFGSSTVLCVLIAISRAMCFCHNITVTYKIYTVCVYQIGYSKNKECMSSNEGGAKARKGMHEAVVFLIFPSQLA